MSALDQQDFLVIHLALDMLGRHTDNELAEARRKGSNATRQLTLITMRTRIAAVRVKISAMEAAS